MSVKVDSKLHAVQDLCLYADAMNVEGGSVYRYMKGDQIWANICVTMDYPFKTKVEYKDIKATNLYPLKESSVIAYNEAQVNLVYVEILCFYIKNAHRLLKIEAKKTARIIVQVHRNTTGPAHIALLKELLVACSDEKTTWEGSPGNKLKTVKAYFSDLNVSVQFCHGDDIADFGERGHYGSADIVFSLSLAGGLNFAHSAGTCLLPTEWIPFDYDSVTLRNNNIYGATNHLTVVVDDILREQSEKIREIVNSKFRSPNPAKSAQLCRKLERGDFKIARIIQSPKIINPSEMPFFKVERD